VIPGDEFSQRIEVRVGGADANPYLVQAAALAAMDLGMAECLMPDEPVAGNAYEAEDHLPPSYHFASDLASAAIRFAESSAARQCFWGRFCRSFLDDTALGGPVSTTARSIAGSLNAILK
jgi:glutamine synthetase